MNYTNKNHLPLPICRAIEDYDQRHAGYMEGADISVTQTIAPPQLVELTRRHEAEIVVDYSDCLWRLWGSVTHEILARWGAGTYVECSVRIKCYDWTVVGTADVAEEGGVVQDWKTTSIYNLKKGMKPEWVAQLNIYGAMLVKIGKISEVKRLESVPIMRDWSAFISLSVDGQRKLAKDVFPCPVVVLEVPIWGTDQIWEYLEGRVRLHKRAREKGEWEPCSVDETWGQKRCARYCDCSDFCPQYEAAKKLKEKKKAKKEKAEKGEGE